MVHFKQKVTWSRQSGLRGEDGYYTVTVDGKAQAWDPDAQCDIIVGVSLDIRDISRKHAEEVAGEFVKQDMLLVTGM